MIYRYKKIFIGDIRVLIYNNVVDLIILFFGKFFRSSKPWSAIIIDFQCFLSCNDHCLYSESQGVRRQVRWGGCDTGTTSRMSGKAMERCQCTWSAMIGEMHELIAEYLGNG